MNSSPQQHFPIPSWGPQGVPRPADIKDLYLVSIPLQGLFPRWMSPEDLLQFKGLEALLQGSTIVTIFQSL